MKGSLIILFIICCTAVVGLAQKDRFIVSVNGDGDFQTVQDAINAVPDFRNTETIIFIRRGIYKEKITLPPTKTNVTIVGEFLHETILTYDDFAQKKNSFGEEMGTSGSSSFFVFGENFKAENITFENSSGPVGQAVAVRVDGDKARFINCRFLGYQDTLYPHGEHSRQYYRNCYIEGTTDFIFGWSTAVFEQCDIYSKTGGQYITAASTLEEVPFGFVFIDCKLTGDAPDGSVYLGRPWRPNARTVFLNCDLGKHIHKAGWHNWNKPEAESTAWFGEYQSTGPGANPEARVSWSHQMNESDYHNCSLRNIFKDWIPNESSILNF